jgi:hypothetical protein
MATRVLAWAMALLALVAVPPAGAQRFAPPVDVGPPTWGHIGDEFQPALAGSADGVWLIAIRSNEGTRIARSRDDGVTWDTVATLPGRPMRSAPALANRDGTWLLVWTGVDGFGADGTFVVRSVDTGSTWSTPLRLDTDPAGTRPLVAASADTWVVVWTASAGALVRRSTNDGLGWTAARSLALEPTHLAASDEGFVLVGLLLAVTSVDGEVWESDASWGDDIPSLAIDLVALPNGRFAAARLGEVSGRPTLIVIERARVADGWQLIGAPIETTTNPFRLATDGAGTTAFLEHEDRRSSPSSLLVERRTLVRRLIPSTGATASERLHTGRGGQFPGTTALGSFARAPSGTWIIAVAVPRTAPGDLQTQQLIVARAVSACADGMANPQEPCDPVRDGATCCSPTCTPVRDDLACQSSAECGTGVCDAGRCARVSSRCDVCEECDGADRCTARVRVCTAPPRRARVELRVTTCDDGSCPDAFFLRWRRGVASRVGGFGDPATDGNRQLCAFASNRGATSILFGATLPGGPECGGQSCWTRRGSTLRFDRPVGAVERLILAAPNRRRSRLVVAASGDGLFRIPPTPGSQITLQLEAPNGACWAAQATVP